MRRSTKPIGSIKSRSDYVPAFWQRLRKPYLYLSVATPAQIGYWYLGSPGPSLSGAPRTLEAATVNIGWALALLLVVPGVLLYLFGDLKRIPPGLGNWRLGLPLTLGLGLGAVLLLYVSSGDAALQRTYPWAGSWPGRSALHFAAWGGLYALYYAAFEFFYRGFVLRVLEPRWGLEAAIWTQALLSTLIHVGKPVAETLAAFPAGFLFAFLAVRTRSLVWPTLLHLIVGLATDAFILQRQGLFL